MKTGLISLVLLCLPVCSWAKSAFSTAYFEAENFTSQAGGNKASSEHFPYIGEGYLDMGGQGATVTWNNITAPKAGPYTLIFKYANNTERELPCDLKVNGKLIKNIPFSDVERGWKVHWKSSTEVYNPENTGWAKYWNARVMVDLAQGNNTVTLKVTGTEGPHIDNIGVSTALAKPPGPVVNVKDHGAKGDGLTDNSAAIKVAIEACPPGGSVVFDEGIYMTGSVELKANMTLWISEGATLRAFQDNSKFQNFSGGFFNKYFMFGSQVDNLTITGGGAIDGNSIGELWNSGRENSRPALLGFSNSKNVMVTNIDLLNSGFWTFVPQESDSVIIDGINLRSIHGRNKDGINPLDCHDIQITNCTVECMDDALCPKSYVSRGIDNLVYRNITVNSTKWKAIKFGLSTVGDFTNSVFEDLAFVHAQLGISLITKDGANVSNIKFNRIKMSRVQTPMIIVNSGVKSSSMKGVSISNIEARDVYLPLGSIISGTQKGGTTYKVEDVSLTNVNVESFKGGLSEMPDPLQEYPWSSNWNVAAWPNFPAWGYTIRHADNVVFSNVTHSVSLEDTREDIVLEDVTGFKTEGQGKPSIPKPNNK
ncbi:glycosyl hydrolase family 28 protein [Planctomycetota bacterium]